MNDTPSITARHVVVTRLLEPMKNIRDEQNDSARRWAQLRFVLGLAQTSGATVSLGLLLSMGINRETIAAVAITFGFTAMSRALCRGRADNVPFGWMTRKNKS